MNLLDLPNELLLLIKHHIGPHDLLAHVAYSKLCPVTVACYEGACDDDPRFWRVLLRASGLGLYRHEKTENAQWRAIAFECAEHAWSCTHQRCGVERFRESREYFRRRASRAQFTISSREADSECNGQLVCLET